MTYDFQKQLEFSIGARKGSDPQTITNLLVGCVSVEANTVNGNDNGIDYIATLRGGAKVNIDVKTRSAGCSKYWRGFPKEPELAIEKWSVIAGGRFNMPADRARVGWSLDESKATDMILYTFDSSDTNLAYLLPFQSLRLATRKKINDWMRQHKVDIQTSNSWQSQAVFVPASQVISAIQETFSSTLPPYMKN